MFRFRKYIFLFILAVFFGLLTPATFAQNGLAPDTRLLAQDALTSTKNTPSLAQESSTSLPPPTQESESTEPFAINLQTTYDVSLKGTTQITHEFTVTNKTPTTFLKQYGLKIHSTSAENIIVKNNKEVLTPTIVSQDNTTSIGITFPDEVVGEGKGRVFSISYQTSDIASLAGKVLEVQIPPVSNSETYQKHTVIVKTPLQFGRAVRVSPDPSKFEIRDQVIITTFDNPEQKPISAFFGEAQFFKMTLRYNLENNSTSTGRAQIAIPPDTQFQKIHILSIDPPTNDLKIDDDGNWIANYTLEPQTVMPVYVTAIARLTLEPNSQVSIRPPLSKHTEAEKYWEVASNPIQALVQQYTTPETIYRYVIDTLNYSYATAESNTIGRRLGALEAFELPTEAVCQEFTDTFVTMARAAQIPARRLTGFAYTQNTKLRPLSLDSDILHAWPEFFDTAQNRWHQVDPTWEDTTGGIDYFTNFDLSHIVFAINGVSSTTPYPAGSYKGTELQTKDVEVTFADQFPLIDPEVDIQLVPTKIANLNVPGLYTLVISNKTGQAWYDMNVEISPSDQTTTLSLQQHQIQALLPYQVLKLPLKLTTTDWSLMKNTAVSTKFSVPEYGQIYEATQELTAGSTILTKIQEPNVVIGLVIGSIIAFLAAGSVLVFRRK